MKTSDSINYAKMAGDLFRGIPVDLAAHGVAWRKGKTVADVVAARNKALSPRYGHAKTETELSSLEMFLKGIFKGAPVKKGLTS